MLIAGHQVDEAMFHYIASNRDADTYKLLLKDELDLSFDKSFAILQLECRRRAKNKIPDLLLNDRFLFPKSISAEQCTHQVVAHFHASLFCHDDNVLDMTMGLGVDDYYISQCVHSVTAIELDKEIADVGAYNFALLGSNIKVVKGDSVDYLKQLGCCKRFDKIFIDPARRGRDGSRKYGFADCQPDVVELLPLIQQHCSQLFIKASPMLDVTQSMRELGECLTDVWAISVKNECKELLFKLDFTAASTEIMLHALNYDSVKWQCFSTQSNVLLNNSRDVIPIPGNYLYEPNASIMKLGCYNVVEQCFNLCMLAPNSHLMISDNLVADFPGRQFRIKEVVPFKDRELKTLGKRIGQANVATRNFRLSADALRKRMRVQDGGDIYVFATTLSNKEQVLILCEKII